jgi:hypothetical protein
MLFVDISSIHEFSQSGQRFYNQMSETDLLELFNLDIIKQLIMFKWPVIQEHIIYYLFIPFLFYLACIVYYTTFLFQHELTGKKSDNVEWLVKFGVKEVIVVMSMYFLMIEFKQIKTDWQNYLTSFWNYIDLMPPLIFISLSFLT